MTRKCKVCRQPFSFFLHRKDTAKYCSYKCHGIYLQENQVGSDHPGWKGGRAKHSEGYWLIYQPKHPFATSQGYVPEHRLVVEKSVSRYVNPQKEHVHHIDGNKKNNDLKNLVLLTPKEHHRIEFGWKKIDGEWWRPCTRCKRFLKLEGNFYVRSNGKAISACIECNAEIARKAKNERKRKQDSM